MSDTSLTTLRCSAPAVLTSLVPLPLDAVLEWWSSTPMEVRLTLSIDAEIAKFHGVYDASTWHFSRELLDTALLNPNADGYFGLGDVKVRVTDDVIDFALMGDAGRAHSVLVDLDPVWKLMLRSYALVPVPAEAATIDVDDAIELLLGETPC